MCQFGQLILRKIIDTVANLPPDLIFYSYNLMHQIRFRLGLCSRPHWATGEHTALPRPPAWILGVLLLREARVEEEAKREKKERERKGEERKRRQAPPFPPLSQFATPLGQASPSRRPGLWVT